jgi:hypothetical protein
LLLTSLFFQIIIIIIIIIKNGKMGRGFKEEVEKEGNAWAIHTEHR